MGMTHITVGIASATLITQPSTVGECVVAIVGGSAGGIICDIEVHSNRYIRDALYARIAVAAIALVSLLADVFMHGPMSTYVTETNETILLIGAALVVGVSLFGRFQPHRTFTHSLLALTLLTMGVTLACRPLGVPFAIGFLSHVLLDLLNKKRVKLFYPSQFGNICFGLCYANGIANKVFLGLGLLGSVVGIGYSLSNLA
jgi:inner membrane protein